jgi:purine-nucleoside/S-methyl-5'-thioadenosine phosphorylase / adenosine deaminase
LTDHPERLLDPRLAAIPTIAHGFFTRRGGVSEGAYASLNCGIGSGDDRDRVLTNRARVAATIGVAASHLVSPYQVHGANVAIVEEPWAPGAGPEADGVVTARIGIAIGVGAADCAPVLFADPEAGVVGAAHAGWGGAFKGVLEATVAAMVGLGARPGRIGAAIGPAIAQQSYEVGPEFRERFHADDPANDRLFRPSDRPGHFRFDLVGYVTARLGRIGLGAVSAMAGLDTYADEARFFSFRRTTHRGETVYGRMISTIALT